MSKIYEALLQAELDRTTGTQTEADSGERVDSSSQPNGDTPRSETMFATAKMAAAFAARTPTAFPPETFPGTVDSAPGARVPSEGSASSVVDPDVVPLGAPPAQLTNIPLCTWSPDVDQLPALEERGSSVEQFRSLRSRMYEFRDLNKLKSILISSGLPREGKSFVATNLAISFARHKAGRVLLIDGDMRRASLHKLLGCPDGPGLTEYLAGKASLEEIMQRPKPDEGRPMPHGLSSLTFIPGGHEGEKAADLSGNHRFDRLIEAVSPFFDWIVVDSSPVNLVSDGVNLARACDAVLLVARGGVTRFEVAQRALNELKASRILGFVLNAVENPNVTGGYYGYDGYDGYDKPQQ